MAGPPPDYVDVAERIRQFYARYPDGSLRTGKPEMFHVGDKTYIAVYATAYRSPEDAFPGTGSAWEPVPGPTPFTRDSELQNAETSAWGRAIVALGFETKHIASADEVRNRSEGSGRGTASSTAAEGTDGAHTRPEESPLGPTAKQHATNNMWLAQLEDQAEPPDGYKDWTTWCRHEVWNRYQKKSRKDLTRVEMTELMDTMQTRGYERGVILETK